MTETITPEETDLSWFADCLNRRPTKRRNLSIPEHAETTTIPTGKYRGVRFKNNRAPYMVRPMQLLSPQSNCQEVRCMFPAQTGKSTIGEQAALYYIQEVPSEILYVSSDDNASRKWMDKRIVPRAQKLGIQFRAQTEDKTSRRTGNTTRAKEFDGGNIDAASSRSPAQLASETKRFVIADETDRWKQSLGAEGFTWDIMYARTQAWGDQKKILAISTPTTFEESLIYPLWEEGTREEYYVPCPICGKKQLLKLADGGTSGFSYETEAGRIKEDNVFYICDFCHDVFREEKKHEILNGGQWIAEATPISQYIASFHINALYSPFKMWIEIAREWEKAKDDPVRRHTFDNLVMGMPHKETGTRPKVEKVIELRDTYKSKEVPNAVLYLTAAADVQRGKQKYTVYTDEDIQAEIDALTKAGKDPWKAGLPRIECEVMGTSWGYRTYSIQYKVFYGSTIDPYSGAWAKMKEWIDDTGLEYTRKDGSKTSVKLMLVDSGDGERTSTVYQFCEQYQNILPCKGDQVLKKNLTEKGDEVSAKTFTPWSRTAIGNSQELITVSTNHYKTKVYHSLQIPRVQSAEQRPGFFAFPSDYPDHYFKMLTNEEKHIDGSFHAGGRPVESLDCRVYNLAAADYFVNNTVKKGQEALVKKGVPREQSKQAVTVKRMIDNWKFNRIKATTRE